MAAHQTFDVEADWVHVQYPENSQFREVYGFTSSQGMVNVEGIRFRPKGKACRTLVIYMHPASTLQLLPMPRAMARHGVDVLCAGSRYAKNDSPLIMEKVILDLGAYVRHAKEVWKYDKVVIGGWSGGGSLSMLYQAQAEQPTITQTPAGDPVDVKGAGLIPGDGMIFQAAHLSRAVMLSEAIDPSVLDENDPDKRDPELDLYHPDNKPPYSAEFIRRFRAAQLARLRRRTAYARETLAMLKKRGGDEVERAMITHRTLAEPRYLDGNLDPNDRKIGTCFLGVPETVNSGPIGLGRFSTLRAWLSQWSIDDTNAHGEKCARSVTVPLLCIENTADDGVPAPHTSMIHAAAASKDKTFRQIKGATHYYAGQPELLQEAVDMCLEWMHSRKLLA